MPYIVAYQKHIDHRTIALTLPTDSGETELCTIGGTTYVSVPDAVTLPPQPTEIADSVSVVTDDVTLDTIRQCSSHIQLINNRVVQRIRERYSVDDELKMLRITPSDESAAYGEYVEECRQWGREQKAVLGL